jgi:hypothetical protein
MDGRILSLEEMAPGCPLQQALKRLEKAALVWISPAKWRVHPTLFPLSSHLLQSTYQLPRFSLFRIRKELVNWIETNKRLMKYEEEGRDADMDRMMAAGDSAASENQKEEQPKSETEKEKASQVS